MSGHSHWKQIKQQKGSADKKRGQIFSKLLAAIAIAAKTEPNPDWNPRLRTAVLKAKESHVPNENIDRAINKASEAKNLEELLIEAYGPEGIAIIIEAITDNRNRTMSEIKQILDENDGKLANPGGASWAFEKTESGLQAKFKGQASHDAQNKIQELVSALEDQDEVQRVITNV